MVAVFYTILWGVIYREMHLADIIRSASAPGLNTGMVMFIMAMAAVFTFILSAARIPTVIAKTIVPYLSNRYVFMPLMLVLLFIAGCIMEVLSLVVILALICSSPSGCSAGDRPHPSGRDLLYHAGGGAGDAALRHEPVYGLPRRSVRRLLWRL